MGGGGGGGEGVPGWVQYSQGGFFTDHEGLGRENSSQKAVMARLPVSIPTNGAWAFDMVGRAYYEQALVLAKGLFIEPDWL